MADITCTSFDDLYDPENDEVDETRPDIRKNLLEDFAAPTAKLTRESVAHSREHMQVHLRIRPFTNREKEQGESQDCMEISQPTSLLMRAPKDSFTFKSSQRGFSNMTHKFTFSRIFGEDTSQKEFFDETMLGTVKDFIDGQNCLVFTYGVTNAGKTYTIQGVPQDGGILPRSLDVIFNSLEGRLFPSLQLKPRFFCDVAKLDERQRKKEEYIKDSVLSMAEGNSNKQEGTQDSSGMDEADDSRASSYTTATEDSQSEISVSSITDDASMPNVLDDINSRIPDDTSVDVEAQGPLKFSVWVSFAEVYNEYIYDLLEAIPKAKKVRRQPLKFSEDKNGQIYIKGLKEISVQSADEAYKILKIGQQNLSMAATKLNHCSSRSHCIFSIKILRVVDVENPHVARVSQLSFCDLAGSERYTRTQNTGDRLKEAGNINTSLLTLGKCIHTLRYNQNHPKSNPKIIPFRESKLTRLFQSFFMGKGKASMVVNVNQCASGFDETLQVLKFSAIAKQVTTVTSKLDNKWKVPAAGGPKLASSRALSLALRQSLSRNRASVAWATPGPQLDSNLDLTTVDESFEEDEDDEEDDEEEEDGERTPRESMVNEESRAALINLVEMLKTQLIEEKKRMMMLEVQIREEVCQEMAQQLVQIEGDYKDQLEKERLTTEEMFEKRLEMYEKSVKTTRKRPRPDDEEEYVSSLLLHAEQTKVQNQEKINEGLRQDIETLKEALEESHEKMSSQDETLTELQRLTEESKQALREAEAKLCAKDEKLDALLHKIQELEDIHKDSRQKLEQETSDKEKVAAEYERSLALKSHAIEELEDTNEELEDANRRLQQQLGLTEKLQTQLSQSESTLKDTYQVIQTLEQDIDKLKRQLEDSENELSESKVHPVDCPDKLHAEKLQKKVTALEKEIKMQVASKAETLSNWHEEKDSLVNTLEQMEHRMTSLLETQKKSESASSEKDERIQHLETQLSQSESSLKDSNQVIRTLGQNVDKLRSQLEESQKQNEAAFDEKVKRIEDLETQLSQSKSSLKDSNQFIKTLEQDIEKLIGRLEDSQKQNEEVLTDKDERIKDLETQLSQSKSSLKDSNQVIKRHEQDIDKLRNQLEDSQRQKETAFTDRNGRIEHLETQLSESESTLRDSNQLIKTLEQDIDKLRSRLEDSQRQNEAALADKNEVLKDIKMQLCDSKSNLKDSNQVIKTLEQDIDKLRSQLENSQKQNEAALAEKDERIKDLEMQLSQSKSTLKDSNQVIKTLEQDIDKLRSQLEDSQEQLSESKRHPADCPDKLQAEKLQKKVTTLEKEIKELVDSKEETLARWREEHDSLVMALDTRVTSLFETQTENEAALSEKDESIQHLKTQLSQSESTLRDTNQAIKILEQDIDKLRSQLEDSQKQNKAALADKDEHVEDLEARLSQSESTLKDSNQVIKTLEQDIDKLRSQLENSQKQLIESKNHPVDCPDKLQAEKLQKKVTALEKEVMKQVASKEETLNKWREDRDSLVKALEQRMTSLLETQEKNEAALAEKDAHIEQLKTKMIENISDSQSVTDDESYIEDTSSTKTKGRSRKGRGQTSNVQGELQREVQQLREQMEKERNAKEKVVAESKRNLVLKSHAIQELEDANRHLQQQLGLIEVTVDVKRLSRSSSESSTTTRQSAPSSSPQPDPDSPDLFIVDVKDQESFHQPGRRRTRVELDLTPLQKKQPARKTRANTRKARKRKSTELLEEIDMDAYQKRSRPEEQSAARPVRSTRKRNTRANRGETDLDQDENTLAAETPSASNRGKRAALSRIGDLLQNTQFAKSAASKSKLSSRSQTSAKKLVESAAAHMTSPTKSPEVQEVAYYPPPTTEKKRKRRLLKTDISVPFESSPFEVLNAGESKSDNSHSIVTRKLRSRNTRV
ncbi:kinesin-like protein KIF20B isoform X4 [Patiria miniata]|uniref:Kinesin motor domain-containing protein n=1 Tax=Patiria miniata TaxID=46514 RepID=A0A914B4C8_PATMI|nr:kinesin-like protein KIF20B isoform X4 [Patiria miniata]